MTRVDKQKLYVNLSASQTRKRLRGHGFGVRRVEAVDRNQAVIIHTATGQHLQELKSLLGGVVMASSAEALDTPIENLRNLGPSSAAWLEEIGIHTRSELQRLGPLVAFRMVRQNHAGTSLNLLWAMVAALEDKDWREITDQRKQRLLADLD